MALSPEPCKISFNWNSDQDDATTTLSSINVIRHTYLDIGKSADHENDYSDDRIKGENSRLLKFVRTPEHELFISEIVCSDPDRAQINGITIESESRTLEFSSSLEGYIKTVRGKNTHDNKSISQPPESNMFICSATFDNPCSDLSIKFLSLGERESISIVSISINMQRHNLHCKKPGIGSSFDLARLKKDVEAMGNGVPAGAFSLLDAMETFEKNKINILGSVFPPSSTKSTSNESDSKLSTHKEALPPDMAAIMQSVLGDNAIENLKKNIPKTAHGITEDNDSIFSMLQAICGKVTETRPSKLNRDDLPDTMEQGKNTANGVVNQIEGNTILLSILDQRLEESKQAMSVEIQNAKLEVMQQIETMKQEFNGQLNQILNLMQSLQFSNQNPSSS